MGDAGDKSMSYTPADRFRLSLWESLWEIPLWETKAQGPIDGFLNKIDDVVDLAALQNPETVFAWVDNASTNIWEQNKELQVKVPIEYVTCIGDLKQRGFDTIVQIAPAYIVLKKGKACTGSTKTETLCIKKLDKLAGQLPPTSNVNPVVPRGNIASSSNPHNLICSQAPVATLAVQTPSKSAGEQFHQLLHSSPDSPSDPVGMGIDNEGAGLEGFSAGSEIPECGVQTKKRRYHGPDLKVFRGPPFQGKEKGLVLKYKSDFLKDPANAGKRNKWSTFVSDNMMKNRSDQDPWRTPSQVRGQWDNLKKGRDALLKFTPPNTNYWDLTMDEKRAIRKENPNFPLEFDYEWFLIMQDIGKMKGRTAANKETQRDGQEGVFSQSLASTITVTGNFAGTDCPEMPGNEPDSKTEAMNVRTDEEDFSDESRASLESHTDMATVDSQAHDLSQVASDEDSQLAKIRTFVKQQIDEARRQWINALRSREEDEHKHRQKMLAIEREKLALMRQKMECIRRFNAVPVSVAKWRGKPPSM